MIKFLYTNKFGGSPDIVASSSAATNFPASNVANPFPKKVWRTTGISQQFILFDLGSAQQLTMFTFFKNNFTTSASVTLRAHATNLGSTWAAWASSTYSQAITSFDQNAGFLSLNQTFRYWFLGIDDPTNTNGFLELGIIFGGVSVSPSYNINENFTETIEDTSLVSQSEGNHPFSVEREQVKSFDFQFLDLGTADQVVLRNYFSSVGKTEPHVIAIDPDENPVTLTRYGLITSDFSLGFVENNKAGVAFTFREAR